MEEKNYAKAAACCCKLLAHDPNNLDGLRNLAIIDLAGERTERALTLINKAVSLRSDVDSIWHVKAQCHSKLGQEIEAKQAIAQASNLGMDEEKLLYEAYESLKKSNIEGAISIAREFIELNNGEFDASLLPSFNEMLRYCCFDIEKKINWLDKALEVHPACFPALSLALLYLCSTKEDHQRLAELGKRYSEWCLSECNNKPLPTLPPSSITGRRIKIGFVSGDFRTHVVAKFLLPLVENLNSNLFEIFCFSTIDKIDDSYRQRFEKVAECIDLDGLDSHDFACKVREYGIDVCIDTAGFTAHNKSQSFAWRMAPIQITMIGYPGSTFTPNMDYIVMDKIFRPEDSWMYSEEALMLDGCPWCFEAPDESIKVAEDPPQCEDNIIIFGSLNNPYKIRSETIKLWSLALKATPNSQMAIVRQEAQSFTYQKNLISEFKKYGIDNDRLVIVNHNNRNIHYLDCYNRIDVALDSYPFTGGTTTMEAILMGVPVVTLQGSNIHQRMSSFCLHYSDLGDCIAKTPDEYAAIASRLAQDVERLRKIRRNVGKLRLAKQGLSDGEGYARRFEKSLLAEMRKRGLLSDDWEKSHD